MVTSSEWCGRMLSSVSAISVHREISVRCSDLRLFIGGRAGKKPPYATLGDVLLLLARRLLP